MNDTTEHGELTFDPPGPGSWTIDAVHFPRPMTRYWAQTHPPSFREGVSRFTRFYGMLLDRLEMRYINGFGYIAPVPVEPEVAPERFARAEAVFEGKLWREQLEDWDRNVKPASIRKHRELLAVDPTELSDEALADYIRRCADHHAAMIAQHMSFTAAAVVPTGDFLAHVGDWTGISPAQLLDLLRDTAPVSAGASEQLTNLIGAIRADPDAREALEGDGDPAETLANLRGGEGGTAAAMSAYLDLVGYRLLDGFDISEPCAIELPDVLLRSIRVAVEGRAKQESDLDAKIAEVREKTPVQHREQFDELLGEATLTYRIRDERGVFSDIWASGIMRRAALAAGARLAERGRIEKAEHFIDADRDEMAAMLAGAEAPSAQTLAERAAYRASRRAKDAPPTLGPAAPPPPDMSGLPPAAARMMRATDIALGSVFGSSEAAHEVDMLRGLAASRGVYEGPARRVSSPAEFDRIEKGDILVTESTTEAFNILLPLLGGIVTDAGGLLSHSAIVAREYGIPGVVGTREATERIKDGVRLRVDGNKGEVTVLG